MNSTLATLAQQWKANPAVGVRIIAFGSSNTEMHWHSEGRFNWVAWLNCAFREHIGKHVVVINQGIGGDTTTGLLNRFDRDILPFHPTAVIITIGGNDANKGVPVDQYRQQLSELIEKVQKIGALPIVQTYYCPLYEKMGKFFQRFPQFVEIMRQLAQGYRIPLIDQYASFEPLYRNNPKRYRNLMKDGLHVNPLGNIIMGRIACDSFDLPAFPIPTDRLKFEYYWRLIGSFQGSSIRSQ